MDSGLFDLSGKVALVTGGTRGMGLAMATGFAQHGARVVTSSRKAEACEAAAAAINEACGEERASGFPCNAGHKDQLRALVDHTLETHGKIDILCLNAGVNPHYGPMAEIPDRAFEKTMQTNVEANHWIAQMVAPGMAERGGGSIMMTSSVGAFHPSTTLGTYGISKLAVIGLVRNIAAEYGPRGVRCNAICPAIIRTDFARKLYEDPEAERAAIARVPLGRLGEPDDVKGLAVFLASPASGYITGQAMTVCGGSFMWA